MIIITGASQGVGEGIALKYAKRDSKIVLTARTKSKLEEVNDVI